MLDYAKVKRIFVFGCSFTQYCWPTWANMLHKEIPNAEFYNFGLCGSGNISIACKLSEMNYKMNFNEHDLIAIMWTTYCREDRYVSKNNGWMMTGNIFTQNDYDKDFVEKFADPKGYMIRDLGLIVMTTNWIRNQPFQSILMPSVPFDYQQDEKDDSIKAILENYKPVLANYPKSMLELELEFKFTWGHIYWKDKHKTEQVKDYHPSPLRYRNYLEKIGLPMTVTSYEYALRSTESLLKCQFREEIEQVFSQENAINHKSARMLF